MRWPFLIPVLLLASCRPEAKPPASIPFSPPSEEALPRDARGEEIRHGMQLVRATRKHLPEHVGNALSCTSCHLEAGRKPKAAPFVGVYAAFPQYRARSARVDTLEDRINDCFQRSLNGKPLSKDSRDMRAMVTYMAWLSEGVPVGEQPEGKGIPRITSSRKPDPEAGKRLYAASCAACHGQNGEGMGAFPPLWGPQSFNIAAGMARLNTAAAFIKWNMPLGKGGSLSNEEAYDLAAHLLSHPRPDYAAKHLDWPEGGKPEDAPY
jgi:thiosulfate dehydrogenase